MARDMRLRSATRAIRASRPATVCDNIVRARAPNCSLLISAAMFYAALLLLLLLLRPVLRCAALRCEQARNGSNGLSLNLAMWIIARLGLAAQARQKPRPRDQTWGDEPIGRSAYIT